ncbi:GPI mannosyltransferase 4 [Bradysia coprophila]|uniref:GPI mannosyltransferase 4 n=1 Tax=Bradysia coprophila TaxID=38358 RepID=UPI00187D9E53|nr:GPI mannosyltransferase 4 [Bradysia coprophila]
MKLRNFIRLFKTNDKNIRTYFALAIVRIVLVFIPQFGYIHPDEFFQSIEVMAGDEYGLEHTRTWEFNTTFPIRSIVVPYFCVKIPLNFLRFMSLYARHYLQIDLRTSYALVVFPRLIMVLISFINDWSLYKICKSYGVKGEMRMIALASSFVMLVFGSRTFSNTIEMGLCSVLLYIVADTMVHSNTVLFQMDFLQEKYDAAETTVGKVKLYKMKSSLPAHSFNKCFLISTLCVVGVFNRPTFLFFGMPIVFYWLMRGMGTRTISFFDFFLRMTALVICALPSLVFFIMMDSLYFGYLHLSDIPMLDIGMRNFVVTPLNFVRYNIDPKNTAQHGIHPKYLHALVNIPLLFNILGVVSLLSFASMVYQFCRADYKNLPRAQSIIALMTAAIFVPLGLLSLINHQEPRFLLPLTLPIIFLHGTKLQTGLCVKLQTGLCVKLQTGLYVPELVKSSRILKNICSKISSKKIAGATLLRYWYIINIIFTLFFGFVHQGGVFQLASDISNSVLARDSVTHVHLVTSHIYNVPLSFFFIPSTKTLLTNQDTGQKYTMQKRFFLYEYGGMNVDDLHRKLKIILDHNEMKLSEKNQKYQLYVAIPTSLTDDLSMAFWRSNSTVMTYERVKVFYPHLSTEALPKFSIQHPTEIETDFDSERECRLFEWGSNHDSLLYAAFQQFSSMVNQFGLALYRIDVGRKNKKFE